MNTNETFQEDNRLQQSRLCFEALTLYRQLVSDPVMDKIYMLVDAINGETCDICRFTGLYSNCFSAVMEGGTNGSLQHYIIDRILFSENIFTREAQEFRLVELQDTIRKAVESDLRLLQWIAGISAAAIKRHARRNLCASDFEKELVDNLPEWTSEPTGRKIPSRPEDCSSLGGSEADAMHARLANAADWGDCLEPLALFHYRNGSGLFAAFRGFTWESETGKGRLKEVVSHDPVRLGDLIGYEEERRQVVDNTLQFLRGYSSNNMLLYGDRGTGKSSTVKALLNEYWQDGLRIIEIPKQYLCQLPQVIRSVKGSRLRFIFFIDDLSFEDSEESYTALKAILEGGLESKPGNVVIYATSNRRHLIKEKFSDRSGILSGSQEDEIRASDTMQEKLSLADRFGITVTFTSPDKRSYLQIVDGLAAQRGLEIDPELLHAEAMKWELWYNGRSPRTARQFIDSLEGKMKLEGSENS